MKDDNPTSHTLTILMVLAVCLAVILFLLASCRTIHDTERIYTHDTLIVHHTDTFVHTKTLHVHDTTRQVEQHYITLNQVDAIADLRGWNRGYTFSNFNDRVSIMVIGKTDNAGQMFDTIVHEMKHLAEHVGEYYGVDSREELSAYLQGEVGRNMWPAAAMVLCPKCH